MLYFEKIKGDEKDIIKETLFGLSLKYLDKSLCYIDNMLKNNRNNEYIYPHLALLMSVAYIRVYLSKFIEIKMNEKKQFTRNITDLIEIINGDEKNNFRKVLKYFILKLIRNELGDYDKFLTFDFQKIQMTNYIREIDFNEERATSNFDYLLLPIDKIDLYKQNWNKFQEASQKLFKVSIEDYVNLINQNNGIDIFFDMAVNKIF